MFERAGGRPWQTHCCDYKRGVIGSYHHWSAAHMHRYLAEFDLRYSTKDKTDGERANYIFNGMEGRRLTYRRIGLLAA